VVVDIPEHLIEEMRVLVQQGEYENTASLVEEALVQHVERHQDDQVNPPNLRELVEYGDESEATAMGRVTERDTTDSEVVVKEFGFSLQDYENLETILEPDGERLDGGPLWGQYNRIFPVKLVVRCLANATLQESEPCVNLREFRRTVAQIARDLGKELAEYDKTRGRTRGEKFSVALPIGDDSEKSLDRFETHFVGRSEHGNELTGATPHLLLVNIQSGEREQIGLTEAGREFASLENPILDGGFDADESLSIEEGDFYVGHIQKNLPEEYEAMQTVARAIEQGDNRPQSLTKRVAYLNPEWSNAEARTMRSGLTSRMYELGLVERERVGQRGTGYELTSRGNKLLEEK
jgi:Arc/MetJ-type ribon-helix-helix transcriptional regulator/predicted transcriptional regulator